MDELYRQSLRNLELRLVGLQSYRIIPLLDAELHHLRISPIDPFWIVFADSTTKQLAEDWRAQQAIPVDVVTSPEAPQEPPLPTWESVRQHCDAVLNHIETAFPAVDIQWAIEARANARDREPLPIEFGFTGHNVTIPNELLLMSVGGVFNGQQQALVGDDAKYLSRILQVADEAAIVRHAVPAGAMSSALTPMPAVILAAPGIFRHVSRKRPGKGQKGLPFFRMLRILQRQTTYGLQVEGEAEMKELPEDPASRQALQLRTLEWTALTNALAVRSASYLCPVLRLTPAVNHTSPALIRLADCLRSDDPSQRKISRLTEKLTSALEEAVPRAFIDRIDLPHSGIKIVSDAPLELLPIRGLPMMLRHITSRIPVTPGNQAFLELLPHDLIELTTDDFKETLVIRSFRDEDPLGQDLETAVRHYRRGDGTRLPVRFVDVRTRAELERAFEDFEGALVVFDGHGRHRRHENYGQLQLADESVNPWDLRKRIRVPPIAFLCACDTHAYDRSHVTPGSGLLACGARAVISTVLPVHSKQAAMFAARLLFRIYEYLPLVTNELRQFVRWDNVFSMLQRMMYVIELLGVIRTGNPNEPWRQEVMTRATPLIHTRYDWYEAVLEDSAQSTGLSVDAITRMTSERLSYPESFKFLHLGNPESIVIRPTELRNADYLHYQTAKARVACFSTPGSS
ncbi:MAG: hypothetical protein KY475_13705 [Planctomycetes bacterium]|nr:hypothetical protein [Planctomycetota bacterium]